MTITQQQYNAVINGIRVQHQIFGQQQAEASEEILRLRECEKFDAETIAELDQRVQNLQMDLANEMNKVKEVEGANAILKEMVATQERALDQAKAKAAKSKK
jgi:hypothetical protein